MAPFEAELEADAVCALLLSAPLTLLSPVPLWSAHSQEDALEPEVLCGRESVAGFLG